MEYNDILNEVRDILNTPSEINLDQKIKEIIENNKEELNGFEYISDNDELLSLKKKFIKYFEYNKLQYGGILYKTEKINNTVFIYLVNSKKQVWKINADKVFIFCTDILTPNQKTRKSFEDFLQKYNIN